MQNDSLSGLIQHHLLAVCDVLLEQLIQEQHRAHYVLEPWHKGVIRQCEIQLQTGYQIKNYSSQSNNLVSSCDVYTIYSFSFMELCVYLPKMPFCI